MGRDSREPTCIADRGSLFGMRRAALDAELKFSL
jgi:hypothetical protein